MLTEALTRVRRIYIPFDHSLCCLSRSSVCLSFPVVVEMSPEELEELAIAEEECKRLEIIKLQKETAVAATELHLMILKVSAYK